MIILEKSPEGIIIGRNLEFPIAVFMFDSWNGTLNTVLVGKIATDDETELLRKIAYQYAEKIWNRKSAPFVRHEMFDIFQESFDEYQTNPTKELVKEFYFAKGFGKFIKNAYDSSEEAVDEIIKQVKEVSGFSISIGISEQGRIIENTVYTVSLENNLDTEFTFWTAYNWPSKTSPSSSLHIIPGYHPSSPSQGGKSRGLLINGATNALISSKVISSVYSPKEARRGKEGFGTTWDYMNHPCKASGKSFQFTLSGFYHSTKELVDDAVQLILAALGAHPDSYYVGISGGFYSTYDLPGNIANRTGRDLPCETTRGSENHCMWTYDVLKEENQLVKAHIPNWFIKENWVKFFEN